MQFSDFDLVLWIADWLRGVLAGWGASDLVTTVTLKFLGAFVVGAGIMVIFILLTWIERKAAARFQDRIGPNRVGPFGLIQPIADAVKMLTKEDTRPRGADMVGYVLAPIVAVFSVLMVWAVVPFTEKWIGADLSVGVMYIAAAGSFGIVAVLLAGWSSNNKYALLGAFRGVATLISYEVPLFLSLLVPVFLARTMEVSGIVADQTAVLFTIPLGFIDIPIRGFFFLAAPLAVVIYFISSLAEVGRAPFDLLEAESELVAGYHVEYSGMKFGLFQAAEFLHSFTFAALMALLFFGGWSGPGVGINGLTGWLLGGFYFFLKTFFFYFMVLWSRLTFPRIRIDQMMNLNWKFMVPVTLVLLMGMPLIDFGLRGQDLWLKYLAFFLFNLIVGVVAFSWAARADRKSKKRTRVRFEGRPVAVMPQPPAAPEEETAA